MNRQYFEIDVHRRVRCKSVAIVVFDEEHSDVVLIEIHKYYITISNARIQLNRTPLLALNQQK